MKSRIGVGRQYKLGVDGRPLGAIGDRESPRKAFDQMASITNRTRGGDPPATRDRDWLPVGRTALAVRTQPLSPPDDQEPLLVTVAYVCAATGLSRAKIAAMLATGELP